jgi:zinc D-Ala-D-Ala carboxypeptidase
MTMLTTNFSLHEMIKSETASRRDMDNTPHSDDVVQNLTTLCEQVLQPLRDVYGVGIKVNSGYRSPDVNAAVGGSRTSDHCKGQAADIEIPGVANKDLALYIRDNFYFTQLILEGYIEGIPDSGWVHVSYDDNNLKQQVLTAVFVKGRAVYSNGIA